MSSQSRKHLFALFACVLLISLFAIQSSCAGKSSHSDNDDDIQLEEEEDQPISSRTAKLASALMEDDEAEEHNNHSYNNKRKQNQNTKANNNKKQQQEQEQKQQRRRRPAKKADDNDEANAAAADDDDDDNDENDKKRKQAESLEKAKKHYQVLFKQDQPISDAEAVFFHWIMENGGMVWNAMEFSRMPNDAGTMAQYRTAVPSQSPLALIPSKTMMHAFSAKLTSTTQNMINALRHHFIIPGFAPRLFNLLEMSFVLMLEYHQREESFFRPYISILPTQPKTLRSLTKEELEASEWPAVPILLKEQFEDIYGWAHDFLENNAEPRKIYANFSTADIMNDFRWALDIIRSRGFQFPSGDSNSPAMGINLCLIPLLELFNHGALKEQCTTYLPVNNSLTISSPGANGKLEKKTYDVSPSLLLVNNVAHEVGDEVCYTYGQSSNAALMALYGFVLDNNPWDYLTLIIRLNKTAPALADFPQQTFVANVDASGCVNINWIKTLSIITNDPPVAEAIHDTYQLALQGIRASYKAFSTSLEDDEALLKKKDSGLSAGMRTAIRYRYQTKVLMATIAARIIQTQEQIASGNFVPTECNFIPQSLPLRSLEFTVNPPNPAK